MVGHKLYSDSLNSLNLNSTMGSKEDGSINPSISPPPKRQTSTQKSPWGENKIVTASTQNNSNSDGDSLDQHKFYSLYTEKQPYTFHEDVEIVKFVLKDQNIYKVSSILLWKYLEAKKKNPKRTYQSLKNRFLRNIKPKLFTTYRHLVETDDQIEKILKKFPELEKEVKSREPLLGLNLPSRKKETEDKAPDHSNTSKEDTTTQKNDAKIITSLSEIIPGSLNLTEEESFIRYVKITKNSIVVTVTRKLGTTVPISHNNIGIYEKYLKFKAENKLIPCSACGRCGGPEPDEVQDSDNDVICNSVESKSPQCSVNSKSKKSTRTVVPGVRETVPRTVKNVAEKNTTSAKKSDDTHVMKNGGDPPVKNVTPPGKKNSASPHIKVTRSNVVKNGATAFVRNSAPPHGKEIPGAKRSRKSSDSPNNTSFSPSLLCSSKSSSTTEVRQQNKKPPSSKTTPSTASNRKYLMPPEHSGDLTDKELESLYQETVQECEKLIDSEEEEELVKKCLKKSRRTIGFDSYVLLNKVSLDSFFAKSQSPPWDSSDAVTSGENKSAENSRKSEGSSRKSESSPLVENMKKMLGNNIDKKI